MNDLNRRTGSSARRVLLAASVVAPLLLTGCGEMPEVESAALTSGLVAPGSVHRPAGVPADFLITPAGYVHPSCIKPIELMAVAAATPCAYPRFDRSGRVLGDDAGLSADDGAGDSVDANVISPHFTGGRWITNANAVLSGVTSATAIVISADITVPKKPTFDGGQVLYLFDGIEPASDGSEILQPVLGFNRGAWNMQNWNCCVSGNVFYDGALPVNPGDVINQTVKGHVGSWDISWKRNGSGGKSFHVTGNGKTFNWLFAGVLEAYDITRCDEYPNDSSVAFRNLKVTSNGTVQFLPWHTSSPAISPSCATSTSLDAAGVTIHYKSH
jgi:hypothetical protein